MKFKYLFLIIIITIFLLTCCSTPEPPVDLNGNTPQKVLMDTYVLILEGKYEEAKTNFSPQYIEEIMTSKNITFIEYCSNTQGWKVEWLKTKVVGNDYNENVWRVKLIPDEGKGKHNRAGIVQDLHIIDGYWKIVFWNHYPKS